MTNCRMHNLNLDWPDWSRRSAAKAEASPIEAIGNTGLVVYNWMITGWKP